MYFAKCHRRLWNAFRTISNKIHANSMNLCLLIPVRVIFQIHDEGTRAKAQIVCLCGYNPIFLRFLVLNFGVKDRNFIRVGYGFDVKNPHKHETADDLVGCFYKGCFYYPSYSYYGGWLSAITTFVLASFFLFAPFREKICPAHAEQQRDAVAQGGVDVAAATVVG